MEDKYLAKWINRIKKAKTRKELKDIVDKIYEDGFEDGANEGNIKG